MPLYHEKKKLMLVLFLGKIIYKYTNICTLYFDIAAFSDHYQTQYLAKNSRFLGRKFLQVAVWSIYGICMYICPSIVYNYTIWSHTGTEPVFVDLLRSPGIDFQPACRYDNPICRTGPPGYIG
jgi:hypothetical protein